MAAKVARGWWINAESHANGWSGTDSHMTKLKTEELAGGVVLHLGDCLKVMAMLPENSVDSCVTDPPYHLQSIHKRFAAKGRDETSERYAAGPYGRTAKGFMGKQWDGGDVAFCVETWSQVFRVLKPGAHLVAFGGTRTYHRMACAIEDAGFEIRDQIEFYGDSQAEFTAFEKSLKPEQRAQLQKLFMESSIGRLSWMYGSGFPKSHDLSKGIDRTLGVKGTLGEAKSEAHAGWIDRGRMRGGEGHAGWQSEWMDDPDAVDRNARRYIPASPEAQAFVGFGTALKPACEPIVLARKPLSEKTVALNVLKWGTGALNIDGCRVEMSDDDAEKIENMGGFGKADYKRAPGVALELSVNPMSGQDSTANKNGRWPANVVHDGSPEVVDAFPDAPGQQRAVGPANGAKHNINCYGDYGPPDKFEPRGDHGSAARFFATFPITDEDRQWQRGHESKIDHAKNVGDSINLQSAAVASVLSNAVAMSAIKQRLKKQSYRALDTAVSEPELRLICASVTEAIQNLERRSALGLPRENISARLDCVISVAIPKPTGTMTIMINLSRSDRFVEVATFDTIAMNAEVGVSVSAKRFHYTAKADDDDRLGTGHPTVKPVDLIQWLERLVTPKGGLVLDPFAGTGTAGEAAFREGMRAWLIEREPEYQDDIRRRMKLVMSGPVERATATNKAKEKRKPVDPGSLFGGKEQGAV